MIRAYVLGGLVVVSGAACSARPTGPSMRMDFLRPTSIFDAPFPSADRQREDGTIDLSRFPNPDRVNLLDLGLALVERDARGFGTTSGIFFSADAPLDPSSLEGVALIPIDGPHAGTPHRIQTRFLADPGPFGAPNLLVLLPVQGHPLDPDTLYAAVVPTSVRFASGEALGLSKAMARLLDGGAPEGMSDRAFQQYRRALDALPEHGAHLASIAVFKTDDPLAGFRKVQDAFAAQPVLSLSQPFSPQEQYPSFCVYQAEVMIPTYQHGTPPFAMAGGGFEFDAAGAPVPADPVAARIFVTLPKRPMPPAGFPVVLFIRTGAGGDRALVDRGLRDAAGAAVPGTGPAVDYAAEGWAGISIDGPLGGLRNAGGADEQFLVYNFNNPEALRDNIRESALELLHLARAIPSFSVATGTCAEPKVASARFDPRHLVLAGHSMGASIAPLAFSMSGAFEGTILSGAGASALENLVYKQKPLNVRGFAELLLGYPNRGVELTEFDPVASLVQWATEPSDSQIFAPQLSQQRQQKPLHVLMFQGIVDHYIMPPIVHPLVRAMQLDMVGPGIDATVPEIASFLPLASVVASEGRRRLDGTAQANLQDGASGAVIQHRSDGIEDGHEVMFQTPEAKDEVRCYLKSLSDSAPRVTASGLGCP
ncbi:MAG: hypothetical protein U1E65_10895 [Myxococcota bacterium]